MTKNMNTFCNGKEISKKNFLSMIEECIKDGWRNSQLKRSTEEALTKIYYGGYEGREEDIQIIIDELNSESVYSGYFYPNANLQDVETIILTGKWFFQE